MSVPGAGYYNHRELLNSYQKQSSSHYILGDDIERASQIPSPESHFCYTFKFPRDERWQRPNNKSPRLLPLILTVVSTLSLLNIAALVYSAIYDRQHRSTRLHSPNDGNTATVIDSGAAPIHWGKELLLEECSRSRALPILIGTVFELLHQPLHLSLFLKSRLHPLTAAILSLIAASLWLFIPSYELAAPFCDGITDLQAWLGLSYARAFLAYLTALLYLVYTICAVIVHLRQQSERRREALKSDDSTLVSEEEKKTIRD